MMVEDVTLENPKRGRLYQLISSDPGITFKKLSQQVSYSVGTLQYHLRILQKEEMIRKEMTNGERSYYAFETRSQGPGHISSWIGKSRQLSELQRKLLKMITSNPEITQNELADALKINRFILYYHLKCLMDRDLITKNKVGREVQYSRIDEGEMKKKLLLELIDELLSDRIDEQTYQNLKKLI